MENEIMIQKKKSTLPIIIVIAAILIVAAVICYFSFFSEAAVRDREIKAHIASAEKYLDDLEYEKAIAEYEAAIELNPMDGDVLDTYVDTVLDFAEIVAEDDVEEASEIIADAIKFLDDVADENRKTGKKIEILEEKREEYLALINNESTAEYDIPDDAFEWNGHYYAIYNDTDTWEEAKVLCEERNGHLATIMSETENYIVSEYVMSMGYYSIYFGCVDESMTGNWIWVTGEKLSYSNWHEGEPNSQDGTERYGMYYFGDDTWNDGMFVRDAYICEWDVGEEDQALIDNYDSGNDNSFGEDIVSDGDYQDSEVEDNIYYEKDGYIIFGAYEQDGDLTNGPEPIEWEVLGTDENGTLLVSRYILDCQPYNVESGEITWEMCSLRSWLNDDFLNSAFTTAEQTVINTTNVINGDNPYYGTPGGTETSDMIFCLSLDEVLNHYTFETFYDNSYKGYSQQLIVPVTQYAKDEGVSSQVITEDDDYIGGLNLRGYTRDCIGLEGGFWWLRSPGLDNTKAINVNYDGSTGVDNYLYFTNVEHSEGIRPALYIAQ